MDIRTRTAIPITVLVVYMNEIRIDVCKPSQLLRPWGIARTNGNGVLIFYSLPLHLSHIKKHILESKQAYTNHLQVNIIHGSEETLEDD